MTNPDPYGLFEAAYSEVSGGKRAVEPKRKRAGVRVKPLEWDKYGSAIGFAAKYAVYETGYGWNCVVYPFEKSHYRIAEGVTESEAKAAAQADFEANVLSVIDVGGDDD